LRQAHALYTESLQISRQLNDKPCLIGILGKLGVLAILQGEDVKARALYEESLALAREVGDVGGIANNLITLAALALIQEDPVLVRAYAQQAMEISPGYRAMGNMYLAQAALLEGDYTTARTLVEEQLAARRAHSPFRAAEVLAILGDASRLEGDYARALSEYRESLTLAREIGYRPLVAEVFKSLAGLATAQGYIERAGRLFGATEVLRESMGMFPLYMRRQYEQDVARARSLIDEEAFAVAWEAGRAMTWEQAVTYALEESEA
jgi:tetratricopeptide (TPR) repeat protein